VLRGGLLDHVALVALAEVLAELPAAALLHVLLVRLGDAQLGGAAVAEAGEVAEVVAAVPVVPPAAVRVGGRGDCGERATAGDGRGGESGRETLVLHPHSSCSRGAMSVMSGLVPTKTDTYRDLPNAES